MALFVALSRCLEEPKALETRRGVERVTRARAELDRFLRISWGRNLN
jgi:hypothetical protein